MNQKDKILDLLDSKGAQGATNRELNNICFRYGARIQELRKDGVEIVTRQVKKGLFKFYLKEYLDE